jgi:hypothetical protein
MPKPPRTAVLPFPKTSQAKPKRGERSSPGPPTIPRGTPGSLFKKSPLVRFLPLGAIMPMASTGYTVPVMGSTPMRRPLTIFGWISFTMFEESHFARLNPTAGWLGRARGML